MLVIQTPTSVNPSSLGIAVLIDRAVYDSMSSSRGDEHKTSDWTEHHGVAGSGCGCSDGNDGGDDDGYGCG